MLPTVIYSGIYCVAVCVSMVLAVLQAVHGRVAEKFLRHLVGTVTGYFWWVLFLVVLLV